MRISVLFLIILCMCFICIIQKKVNYSLINDSGIYVEKFDSLFLAKNKYSLDNKIFKIGNIFTYDYYYLNSKGKKFKFIIDDHGSSSSNKDKGSAWHLVDFDSIKGTEVNKIKLVVDTSFDHLLYSMPGFSQTIITYYYIQKNGLELWNESTGVIENKGNTWIHPPRSKLFRILELNAFPFIKAPFKIGSEWEWTNNFDDSWADSRWKEWQGQIHNTCNYKIVDLKEINTHFGMLKCFEVESTAKNKLGSSYLTSFFNEEKGFVKLEYTNIDSTKIVFELLDSNARN